MNSMTGFGRGAASAEGRTVQVEISTVNRKNLDLQVTLPGEFTGLDAPIRRMLGAKLHRGRVQVRVSPDSGRGGRLLWDSVEALRLMKEVNDFASQHGLTPLQSVSDLARLPGVFQEPVEQTLTGEMNAAVLEAVETALGQVMEMRGKEGEELHRVLSQQLEDLLHVVNTLEPLLQPARESKEAKLREAAERIGEIGPEMQTRLLQEIAVYGEKTDVREEVDRLKAHLTQAQEKLTLDRPVGRALDFLCQELNREFNTLSVKASRTEINQLALEGKERVETLREQVQNVE